MMPESLQRHPRSDMHIARLLAASCIALYVIVLAVVFFIGSSQGASPEKMMGLTLGSHADTVEYQMLAENMLNEHRFALSPEAPTEFARVPGYPVFIALILVIFHTMLVVPVIQIALTAGTVALIYLIGARYFPRPIALFAAALYMIDPIVMFATFWPLSESLFMLLFIGSIYAIDTPAKRTWLPFLVAGILLGLSAYARHAGLYLSPIIACIPAIRALSWHISLRNAAIFIVAALIVMSPWMIRNYSLSGHFAFSSFTNWELFVSNMSIFEQARTGIDYQEIMKMYSAPLGTSDEHLLRQFTYSDQLGAIWKEKIFAHPYQYALFHALTTLKLFVSSSIVIVTYHMHQAGILPGDHAQGPGTWGMLLQHRWSDALVQTFTHIPRLIERIFLALMYANAFYTAILALFKRRKESAWIVCIFVLINVYAAMVGTQSDDTKYRIVIEPFIFMLGAYGLYTLWPKIRSYLGFGKATTLPLFGTKTSS